LAIITLEPMPASHATTNFFTFAPEIEDMALLAPLHLL
jgi:hypothetical protein